MFRRVGWHGEGRGEGGKRELGGGAAGQNEKKNRRLTAKKLLETFSFYSDLAETHKWHIMY